MAVDRLSMQFYSSLHPRGPHVQGIQFYLGNPGYTDDALAYVGLRRPHATVKHSAKEYVDGMAHTNGMESFWAMLKRGYQGVYHQFSAKHLHRYVGEFEGRHNARPMDTAEQMAEIVRGMIGKRLRYADLIGPEYTRLNTQLGLA